MNRQSVDYKQYDKRWANVPYNGPGETDKTIQSSGCGPTVAAMVIATLKDNGYLPTDACQWSRAHGFKYKDRGTAYGYFVPQFNTFGIKCRQLLQNRILNKPNHPIHEEVRRLLADGYWIVALMGTMSSKERGTWTSGGHYILVWDWDDKVRILDPIHVSGNNKYCNGDPWTFRNEARMYWAVDARAYNREDWTDMTTDEVRELIRKEAPEKVVYKTVEDVNQWYRPTIQKLVAAKAIQGVDDKGTLNISDDICRILSILDKLGILDSSGKLNREGAD